MNPIENEKSPAAKLSNPGFTLVELLVVMSLIIVMMSLVAPALNSMKGGADLTKTAYDIAGTLNQARTYAMGNNTYVYVGIQEVDATQSVGATPQKPGTGRIGVAIIASKDGTSALSGNGATPLLSGSYIVAVQKLQRFENMHLADFLTNHIPATAGPMAAYVTITGTNPGSLSIGNKDFKEDGSEPIFCWPLNSTSPANAQFSFSECIQFNSQGEATLLVGGNKKSSRYLEVALQQTHGSTVPSLPDDLSKHQSAVVLINSVTGANRIFRP